MAKDYKAIRKAYQEKKGTAESDPKPEAKPEEVKRVKKKKKKEKE